ncbi:MAG: DUF456 domain-containing protein [Kiritimatiellales bacterium]
MAVAIGILTALLCLVGLILSLLAFSGTWLVLLAALLARLTLGFPNIGILAIFILLCIIAELLEAFASFFGVRKRGGSHFAGFAALIGGLAGAAVGSGFLPILGTFAGLLAGSFSGAFLAEWLRLKHHGRAAHIAWGAVCARLAVSLIKTTLTLGMSIWLLAGLLQI